MTSQAGTSRLTYAALKRSGGRCLIAADTMAARQRRSALSQGYFSCVRQDEWEPRRERSAPSCGTAPIRRGSTVTAERIGDQRLHGVKADGLALTQAKSMTLNRGTEAPKRTAKKLEE